MPLSGKDRCARCGVVFESAQTRYQVTITLAADFDGFLGPPAGPGELARIEAEIEDRSEEELMGEVYQRMSFIICKPCRDLWIKSPLGAVQPDDPPTKSSLIDKG